MNDESQEAKELAHRAGVQAKHAAKNAARAAKTAVEPIAEAVVDEAEETAQKIEGTAEDAVATARRVNSRALSSMAEDMGWGFFALSVSLYTGAIAINKFRDAFAGRRRVLG